MSEKSAQQRYYDKTCRINGSINPDSDPNTHSAWQSLLEKHGGQEARGAQAAALREAILSTQSNVTTSQTIDIGQTVSLTLLMPKKTLLSLEDKAAKEGIEVAQLINQALHNTIIDQD